MTQAPRFDVFGLPFDPCDDFGYGWWRDVTKWNYEDYGTGIPLQCMGPGWTKQEILALLAYFSGCDEPEGGFIALANFYNETTGGDFGHDEGWLTYRLFKTFCWSSPKATFDYYSKYPDMSPASRVTDTLKNLGIIIDHYYYVNAHKYKFVNVKFKGNVVKEYLCYDDQHPEEFVVEVPVDQITLNPTDEPVEHEPLPEELTIEQQAMAVLLDKDQDGVVEAEEIAEVDQNQDQVITMEEIAEARGEEEEKLEAALQEVVEQIQEEQIEVVPTITLAVPEGEDIPTVEEVLADPEYDPGLFYQWNLAAKLLDNLHKGKKFDWRRAVQRYFTKYHINSPNVKIIGDELQKLWDSFRGSRSVPLEREYYVDGNFMTDEQFTHIEDLLTDCEITAGRIDSNLEYLNNLLDRLPSTHLERLRRHSLVRNFTDRLSHIEQTYARL